MTGSEFQTIESELSIRLPEAYKHAVVPFQVAALAGNTEYALWDNAAHLVKLNRELRAGTRVQPPWPPHFYALGDPHGDEMLAIDTRFPDGPVWWFHHGIQNHPENYQIAPNFADWVEGYYRDLRTDLESDGYNPDGNPEDLARARSENTIRSFQGCLLIFLLVLTVFLVFFMFLR